MMKCSVNCFFFILNTLPLKAVDAGEVTLSFTVPMTSAAEFSH